MADCMKAASEQLHQLLLDGLGRMVAEEKVPAVPVPSFRVEIPADKSTEILRQMSQWSAPRHFAWHRGRLRNCCWNRFL